MWSHDSVAGACVGLTAGIIILVIQIAVISQDVRRARKDVEVEAGEVISFRLSREGLEIETDEYVA